MWKAIFLGICTAVAGIGILGCIDERTGKRADRLYREFCDSIDASFDIKDEDSDA